MEDTAPKTICPRTSDEAEPAIDLQARVDALEKELSRKSFEAKVNDDQLAIVYDYMMGLYEVIPGALIAMNANGVIERSNEGARKLLDYRGADLRGQSIAAIWPRFEQVVHWIRQHHGEPGAVYRHEVTWTGHDGVEVPVLLSASGQWSADHFLSSVLLIAVDLRERKKLEMDLRQAQKMESIGQLAAGIAHEINTPMQFIGDNLEFSISGVAILIDAINGKPHDDCDFVMQRLPRALQKARDGAERVNRIVQAMKVFAHPSMQFEPADINEIISNALIVTRNDYKHHAEVEFEAGSLPLVSCSRSEIGQVMLNLVVNAAHATRDSHPQGGGRISLKTTCSADQSEVTVAIADNGAGIPAAIRHRVFDPFFTTKPVGQGTGQGLTISHSIVVDMHHGKLWFESEEKRGTTFYIVLPVNQEGIHND